MAKTFQSDSLAWANPPTGSEHLHAVKQIAAAQGRQPCSICKAASASVDGRPTRGPSKEASQVAAGLAGQNEKTMGAAQN